MKYWYLFLVVSVGLAACSKDKTQINESSTASGIVKLSGSFYPTAGIRVSGSAKVLANGLSNSLLLEPFTVSSGPDLKVYLSKTATATAFINLGPLKNNNGSQSYAVPPGTDFTVYKYALIHCQQYNHLFAIAELKP